MKVSEVRHPQSLIGGCDKVQKNTKRISTIMEYFHHLPERQVIICKECQYAVWPSQVRSHLQGKQHRIPGKEAAAIQDDIKQWPGVVPFASELEIPRCIPQPIAEVPLYTDGLQCQLSPVDCQYICRKHNSIQKHWKDQHNWSIQSNRGGSGQRKQRRIQARFQQGAREVHCQRLFPSGYGSQYFEIRQPEQATQGQAYLRTSEAAWARVWQRANEHFNRIEEETRKIIQPGEITEVTPWIRRTGWAEYLEGCDREELLESIAEPEEVEDDDNEEVTEEINVKKIERMIWKATGEMAAASQATVQRSGVMLRLEAVRTEVEQKRYQPLQPYQEASSIERRCRPWQEMLMFFVRTMREHSWKSPKYRFNRRQFAAFEQLIEVAEEEVRKEINPQQMDEDEDNDDNSSSDHQPGSGPANDGQHKPLTAIQKACLTFCIELMNQTIHNREYDMALVCAAAVLGVHRHSGGFRDPESYPPVLSSIIKVGHFMVVQQGEELAQPEEEDDFSPCNSADDFDDDSGYESNASSPKRCSRPRQPIKRCTTSFDWVKRMMDRFMVRGTASPMQWLLDLRTYGLKIHYNTTAVGHVNWKDTYTLEYKALRFSMDDFRGMVHQLVQDTRRALLEDVLFVHKRDELPSIPWDQLHDDPTNNEVRWSFLNDQRSRLPTDGKEWLFARIRDRRELYERFVRLENDNGYDRERVKDWMRQVARFRGLLLILMHITGGQPARGSEILSVRHRNTATGEHRNLFIEDGTVVFVTKYHKGFQISGDVKIIHRYLPREVGELVVWYLWLALPFIQQIEALVWRKQSISSHLWPADATGKKWTTDRMKEELQRVSTKAMGQSIHFAAYREIAIAISRRWIRRSTAFQQDENEENEEWQREHMDGIAADEQAAHSPHIAGSIYARDSMELFGATADRRQQFRAVSTDWHRFLGFESIQVKDKKVDLKRKRCVFEDDVEEEQVERRIRLRRMDATAELRRMMRKEVSFRSVQGEAMEAIQRGDSPIVAVMPTGSGKSVLFMLPAWVEPGGVTIVVVPLKALKKDMIHRCEQIGIRCAVWDGKGQPDGASIVLVTPEKATSEEFGTFINRMRQTRRLDRIVIDEGHVVLNEQLDFRKHLQQLGKLAMAETQVVLLTATLPPAEEDRLFERMYWRRQEVHIVRASTVRQNIQYSVIDGGQTPGEKEVQLERMVGEVLGDPMQPHGKVVVMCESKAKVKEVVQAGLFPCEMFHADLSEESKEETLNDFRAGGVRVIVATGAFGMGIDIPDIRLIVHVDNPRNMMDYGQASGRAGRDGLPSRAIIIRGGIDFKDELVEQYVDAADGRCRRVEIDQYLDGDVARDRCQEGEYFCDKCEGNVQVTQASGIITTSTQAPATEIQISQATRTRIQVTQAPATRTQVTQAQGSVVQASPAPADRADRAQVRREIQIQDQRRQTPERRRIDQVRVRGSIQEEIQQRLERWKNRCVICQRAGRASRHSMSKCSNPGSQPAEVERRRIQRTIRFGANAGCYKCGVPRRICERWTADGQFRTEADSCQFFGILIGVVCGVRYGYPSIWGEWVEKISRQGEVGDSVEEIEKFLAQPTSRAGLEGNGLLEAFMWTTARIEDKCGFDRQRQGEGE